MELYNEDCIEGVKRLADNSVDMILTDLPYNLTACKWDKSEIDLAAMWEQFRRILKPCCSVVLFASGRFVYKLVSSNLEQYKYKWIWVKNAPTFFVHAKNAPMRKFEEILVFSDGSINHPTCTDHRMKYNPQGVVPCVSLKSNSQKDVHSEVTAFVGKFKSNIGKDTATQVRGGKLKRNDSFLADGDLKTSQLRSPIAAKNTNRAESIIGDRPSRALGTTYLQEQTGYPTDVLEFDDLPDSKFVHNTDKVSDVCLQGGKLKGNWRDGYNWERHGRLNAFGNVVGKRPSQVDYYIQEQTGYPSDVLEYKVPHTAAKLHPTQKPVDLLEFLIRTYTDEGETVLDATMGSGSTGVAAVNAKRDFIGFELSEKFFDIAKARIDEAINPKQMSLFA